ncbi:MAG: hypothetical protein ACKPKO_20775, partial [Candidatus Fonsibacter sp.]
FVWQRAPPSWPLVAPPYQLPPSPPRHAGVYCDVDVDEFDGRGAAVYYCANADLCSAYTTRMLGGGGEKYCVDVSDYVGNYDVHDESNGDIRIKLKC